MHVHMYTFFTNTSIPTLPRTIHYGRKENGKRRGKVDCFLILIFKLTSKLKNFHYFKLNIEV